MKASKIVGLVDKIADVNPASIKIVSLVDKIADEAVNVNPANVAAKRASTNVGLGPSMSAEY